MTPLVPASPASVTLPFQSTGNLGEGAPGAESLRQCKWSGGRGGPAEMLVPAAPACPRRVTGWLSAGSRGVRPWALPWKTATWKVLNPTVTLLLNFILNNHKLLFFSFNKYVLFKNEKSIYCIFK